MAIETRKGKDGKPQYRVRIAGYHPVTGKRQNLTIGTFRTKKEAEREERDGLQRRDRGTLLHPDTLTVAQLLDTWLAAKANEVSRQSHKDYEIVCRLHLKPALGAVLVQKLTADRVQAQYDTWTVTGMRARQLRGCHLRLSQALDYAVKRNVIYVNVCGNVSPPRLSTKKAEVWSADEARRFLDVSLSRPVLVRTGRSSKPRPIETRPDELTPLWHLLLLEGMRRGEALGLRWQDVNWERGTAHIVQTVAPDKSSRGEPIIQDHAKTKSSARTVRLTAETLSRLKAHRTAQAERRLAAVEWADHDLIVCTSKGTPINPNNVTRSFNAIVKAAGLRRITPHGLRHTHATMLLGQGVHPKIVSERLGHASIAITLDTYSHVLPDAQDSAVDAIDAVMAAAKMQA